MVISQNLDGLRDLFIFMMVNDRPTMYHTTAMEDFLNQLAREYGYYDWVDAYHKLQEIVC